MGGGEVCATLYTHPSCVLIPTFLILTNCFGSCSYVHNRPIKQTNNQPTNQTEVLNNPFEDIKPRKLAPRVPVQSEEEAKRRKKEKRRRVKAIKDYKLMSFGEEAEEEEQLIESATKKVQCC